MSSNCSVLITGGAGFLGSRLAEELLRRGGISLRLVDSFHPGLGANLANLRDIQSSIDLRRTDILDVQDWGEMLSQVDLVLHCAGNGDHGASMRNPLLDLDLNVRATLTLLEAVKQHAPKARLIALGSRAEYGPVDEIPVSETAPTRPRGCYAVSKLAATNYVDVYARCFGLNATTIRLTNIYGPHGQIVHPGYLVANWFIRQVLVGEPITLYGDGSVCRDYIYVDDAVDGILALAEVMRDQPGTKLIPVSENYTPRENAVSHGSCYNLGGTPLTSLKELASAVITAAGQGSIKFVDYPPGKAVLEPGHFQADSRRLQERTGWQPKIDLEEGMKRSISFFKAHLDEYLQAPAANFTIDPQRAKNPSQGRVA